MMGFWESLWPQLIAGVAAGLLVLAVQLIIDRRKRSAASVVGVAGNFVGDHNTVEVAVDNRRIDRRTITNNIHSSQVVIREEQRPRSTAESTTDDPWTTFILYFAIVLAAVALFLALATLLFAVTIGACIALVIGWITAFVRTRRELNFWPGAATTTTVDVAITSLAAIVVWVGVFTTQRGQFGVLHLQKATSQAVPVGPEPEWVRYLQAVGGQMGTLLREFGWDAVFFLGSILIGPVFVGVLTVSLSVLIFDWLAYLRFAHAAVPSPFIVRRAERFTQHRWSRPVLAAILAAVAIAASWGLLYDWTQFAKSPLPSL